MSANDQALESVQSAARVSIRRSAAMEQLRIVDPELRRLKLPDWEAEWIREHPGDLLTPGRPVLSRVGNEAGRDGELHHPGPTTSTSDTQIIAATSLRDGSAIAKHLG